MEKAVEEFGSGGRVGAGDAPELGFQGRGAGGARGRGAGKGEEDGAGHGHGGGGGQGSPRRSSAAGMAAAAQYFGSPSGRNRGREAIRKFVRAAAHI